MGGARGGSRVGLGAVGCALAALLLVPSVGVAAPLRGILDRSLGGDGRVFSDLGHALVSSQFTAMVRQPDGKLVLTGTLGRWGQVQVVERRVPGGTLDEGFGDGGIARIPKARAVRGLAVRGDGRILIGAPEEGDVCGDSTVRSLLPTGAPDQSFGSGGVSATVPLTVRYLALDAYGGILVAGRAAYRPCGKSVPPTEMAVARFGADGHLDRGFGDEGMVRFHAEGEEQSFSTGLAVREDGTILVAGSHHLLGLTPTGALAPGFGTGGVARAVGSPKALLALPGGGALVAGSNSNSYFESCCRERGDFMVSRYRPDGGLDPSFGNNGTVSLDLDQVDDASALALAPDGSIVLAGGTSPAECSRAECPATPILARFTADGAVDPVFGPSGWIPVEIPDEPGGYGFEPQLPALAIAPDGQLIAMGGAGGHSDAFILARNADGRPDPRFGSAGAVVERRTQPSTTQVDGLGITSSGEILVSAWSTVGTHRQRAILLHTKPDGGFDPSVDPGEGFVENEAGAPIWVVNGDRAYSLRRRRVIRFNDSGRLDRGYGSDGAARLPSAFRAVALDVRHDGGAVAVGRLAGGQEIAAFELTPGGLPDRGFGHDGLSIVGFGGTAATEARSVGVDSSGRVLLLGRSGAESIAARLLPDGRLDRGFAQRGRLRHLPFSGLGETGIAFQRGGGILLAGRAPERGHPPLLIQRLRADGSRDRSFGHAGRIRIGAGGPGLSLFASRRQILLVSARWPGSAGGVVLRAYGPDGAVDRRFGHGGITVVAVRSPRYFRPVAAARQPGGRIVVAATVGRIGEASDVELLRFR